MPATVATVLVFEENAAMQELIDQVLREAGHRVLGTKNSLEAVELVRRVRIDVLIAGALLDEEREELIHEFCSIQPALAVVSMCGPDDELGQVETCATLSSPVSLDELLAAVEAALGNRES
jgi:DNA-binding NtrC family response regulator